MAIKPETRFYLNSSHTCVNQVLVDVEIFGEENF